MSEGSAAARKRQDSDRICEQECLWFVEVSAVACDVVQRGRRTVVAANRSCRTGRSVHVRPGNT